MSSGRSWAALTSFIGRRRELTEVKQRMAESRLVTLTGPGGVGKTRIALESVERSRRAFRDGIWIIELASLGDASRVPQVVVSALDLPDQSNRDPVEKLVSYLRSRHLLIVLDNCEHLLEACASLAETLLRESPGLHILATSREPLGLSGEGVCLIRPLPIPPAGEAHGARGVAHYEAVSLLVDRARNVLPDFEITDENVDAVVQLCNQLDGVPLAIELAATRLRSLSITQIVERLDRRFSLLTGGNRAALPRQQTLRALIDWSFDLCTEHEQLLWARLSVFPGSFDLYAVEQTCGFSVLRPENIIDLLDRLVAKSLVLTERTGEKVRYRQLMTVREYGAEVLHTLGETESLKRRHRDHFLREAAVMVKRWCGPWQASDLAAMDEDHASLLSALEWSATTEGEIDAAAELASLLRYHWILGGYLSDGRRWLDQLLESETMSVRKRGQALWVSAWIALMQGDRDGAAPKLDECDSIAATANDDELSAHATHWRGLLEYAAGDIASAIRRYERSIDMHGARGDTASVLSALFMLAAAQAYSSELGEALRTCGRVIDMSNQVGEKWCRSYALWISGLCHWHRGDLSAARQTARQALTLAREFKDRIATALIIELMSWCAASTSDYERSAELAGAASAIWAGLGTDVNAFGFHLHHDAIQSAKAVEDALGTKRVTDLKQRYASVTLDAAAAMALGTPNPTEDGGPPVASPLTKRESQVAGLVAQGLSNRSIAEALVLSPRTVDGHVERILVKLDFSSRAQIASWVASGSRTTSV